MKKIITLVFCVLLSLTLNAQTTEVIVKDSSGNIMQIGYLNENNKKESVWLVYSDKGIIVSSTEYKDGKKNGTCRMYDEYGHITFKVEYINGKKRKGKQWDEKGRLIDYRVWDSNENLICEKIRKY